MILFLAFNYCLLLFSSYNILMSSCSLSKIGWCCKKNGSNGENDSNAIKTQVIHISDW